MEREGNVHIRGNLDEIARTYSVAVEEVPVGPVFQTPRMQLLPEPMEAPKEIRFVVHRVTK